MRERQREVEVLAAPVGRLATLNPDGSAHVVPLCFVLAQDRIYWAVDQKPKRTRQLRRLANLIRDPRATLLVDHYEPDWDRLWWVRIQGRATVLEPGPEQASALELLRAKYPQYAAQAPAGPFVRITIDEWSAWPPSINAH
ncbi:MAG: TIGR03668 family PPOX class F420-dependent oxidoreductase [Candidatus Dormibacteraeota bacterium]|uniref:TIGR03668 family PPOX class F420-dependent oxidoreductase n=1 Tax=Candidatus Dormiibacter inghamiae TaxID=3127013 RepID=A0A934K9G2_9BACT|nr:TIGR03668 family PPOX class F420-dependent oxidoreductase [Candidatus Dormibacteraeota bacterium]MBJ7605032.1 TIGR03668 family PPOX class F420-dependent oxidoreductase [Candidatus Dormibacteraeota bacterium]